jgi:GTP 3',8-cyclase
MLIDQFGRHIDYLRVSLTDRCNFRCTYCMPEDMQFAPKRENLETAEIILICQAFVELGVKKIRLTGGEPLIHPDFAHLLGSISQLENLERIALTTNGALLADNMAAIKNSKVKQLNISLDSVNAETFSAITRVGKLAPVLAGIDAAIAAGVERIRLNAVVSKGFNDTELTELVDFAVAKGIHIAFIEEMPMGKMPGYSRSERYLSNDAVKAQLSERFNLIPQTQKLLQSGPARYYAIPHSTTQVGFISPHSNNFCGSCNRVRVTRKGGLVLCLGDDAAVDLRSIIRESSQPLQALKTAIITAMTQKPESHRFDINSDEVQVVRFMNMTGG